MSIAVGMDMMVSPPWRPLGNYFSLLVIELFCHNFSDRGGNYYSVIIEFWLDRIIYYSRANSHILRLFGDFCFVGLDINSTLNFLVGAC
jgi:hypothetical protein